MISTIFDFFKYIFNINSNEIETDEDKENFLADELLRLEFEEENRKPCTFTETNTIPDDAKCFQRNGIITDQGDDYVLINGDIYYDTSNCSLKLNVDDNIIYLGYKDPNERTVVVRIIENKGYHWGDDFQEEEQKFDVIEHILVGQVKFRQERFVFINESDLKFNLDDVEGTFVPIQGDWIEIKSIVQKNNNKPSDISANQVLKVMSFKALRTKIKSATVTEHFGEYGTCNKNIYFNKDSIVDGVEIQKGSKVMVEAVESTQGHCVWRALKVLLLDNNSVVTGQITPDETEPNDEDHLKVEKDKNIEVTYPIKFCLNMNKTDTTQLKITNKSKQTYVMNKWIILGKKRDSQINVKPFLNSPVRIESGNTFVFSVECTPKFFGTTRETFILLFRGFQVKRIIEIDVVNDFSIGNINENSIGLSESQKVDNMQNIRQKDPTFVPGVKSLRSCNFIAVRIGNFPIPDKIWSVLLGDPNDENFGNRYEKTLSRIDHYLPCLNQELNVFNYTDIWHTLLYMEEIEANINMRVYDKSNIFLLKYQDYLGIEIPGLAERRPSLIKGDRALVKDAWDKEARQYEGFVHEIRGNLVLMKFNPQFQSSYSGSDVSIEFHFSRTIYRRAHHSINLAISNLGSDILFPSKLKLRLPQVTDEAIENIKWYNNNLNSNQKAAVTNILRGECRPLPYIIFGPPGTGKTITVIETVLQILTQIPESRILIATPSNSASNLVTERLIKYKDSFSGSVVRIIANYLVDSDTIPEAIKPFCATIDISAENSAKSKHTVKDNMNLSCQKSFIGRHRVTIGTCNSLGAMKHWDLPRGHFTHIIVDEAGQATEPEIMVPLTFTDKEYGQIILAGDPMQLGPVVVSKYCKEYFMDESYLCRILQTFPYLKDKDAFKNGFDDRLVTKLNDNYRSLEEVLKLPSEMFYDGSLVVKMVKDISEIMRLKKATSSIFQLPDINDGGGIFVYGINGTNTRAEDSPSWYNPQEASMVALTACKLYKNDVIADEIGIITPYIAQVKYLRLLFDSMGLPRPKIGTVEEFQGQERPIILISTVRSAESHLLEDLKHALGFLRNPKRLNVAITRAQISVILFCNPYLLTKDRLWNNVIGYSISQNKYMGCKLPLEYSSVTVNEEL
ncbi:probable RNA helicase armi [Aricia agestis]|uniref:probable RNA helicase armi n=1 Tax=Aricia agestis TaxID=91739 RepID=UPI001C204D15|nr:probable RNA helicase armi [Aricia agestis]XP_041975067.1 probable RNA helicase armi [Aricia agestis]